MNHIVTARRTKMKDDEAFSELIDQCREQLYTIAFAYLKDEQNSLDAVSEAIYKAYMNISKLKIKLFFSTWVIKILINSCNDIF